MTPPTYDLSRATHWGDRPLSGTGESIAVLHDGDFVGARSRSAILHQAATVRAKRAVEALRIRKGLFFELFASVPEMAVEMTRLLAERLTRTTAELVEAQRQLAAGLINR